MQSGDQPNSSEPAYDLLMLQSVLFPMPESHPLLIREFLNTEQPRNRLAQHGAAALSDAELLAVITGVPCLETAQRLLIAAGKSNQTIHATLNPASQPTRRGGVRSKTAADLAKTFAELTGCSEDEALRRLFVAP